MVTFRHYETMLLSVRPTNSCGCFALTDIKSDSDTLITVFNCPNSKITGYFFTFQTKYFSAK